MYTTLGFTIFNASKFNLIVLQCISYLFFWKIISYDFQLCDYHRLSFTFKASSTSSMVDSTVVAISCCFIVECRSFHSHQTGPIVVVIIAKSWSDLAKSADCGQYQSCRYLQHPPILRNRYFRHFAGFRLNASSCGRWTIISALQSLFPSY